MHVVTLLAEEKSGGSILGILPLLLIPVALYFLMIRPQRRRQREAAALQSSIEVGDEVMTTSGVYGFVTGFDGDIAWLEIDDNVQIRVARAAIQRKVDTSAPSGTGAAGSDTARAEISSSRDDSNRDDSEATADDGDTEG